MTLHPSAAPPAPLSAPQTSAGLFIPPRLLVLLRWPYRPLSRLGSSLRLRVGLHLPPPTRLCLLRACATPPGSAVLRVSVLCRMVLRWPSVPIIEPCLIISCSVYYYGSGWPFCRSLGLRWPYLWLSGSRGPLRSSSGLGWPPLALLLLRVHPLVLGFLSRLRSLAWCRSLRGPQPVVLRCLNVRQSDLPPFLIVFPPGFVFRRRDVYSGCGFTSPFAAPRCHGVRVYVLHGEGCGLLLSVPTLALYISFGSLFYACPSLKCPVGLCYMDTWSAEGLGFLRNSSHFPGLCRFVLTCSHDSLFLRYPAIDIVWRGPVSLALGFLRPLALCGSAWWSPSPGWCSIQSFSRTSVLPFLTLTHTLTVAILLR